MAFTKLLEFWQKAAIDLGLQLDVPFSFLLPSGRRLEALLLVKQFGAERGMLIFGSFDDVVDYMNEISDLGYGFAVLGEPMEGEEYNLREYIELLMDWGWSDDDQLKPSWLYTDAGD